MLVRLGIAIVAVAVLVAAVATRPAARPRATPLTHDAYVWQRRWTGAVRDAVTAAPAELAGLRVLAVDVDAAGPGWAEVDAATLAAAGRPVTAVVRIAGARLPAEVPMADVLARIAAWRAAGVDVVGLEIDHDCATAALPAYARWLAQARPPAPLRFSITALPTWADSVALGAVAAAVDELVVQVHAVRAPTLFEPRAARAGLARFAAAVPASALRVALPTYDAVVAGTLERSRPTEVAGFLRWLERGDAPPIRGVVWFRLPVPGDDRAWPAATLRAVITGAPLRGAIVAELVATGPARADVRLRNTGTIPAAWPTLTLSGAVRGADLIGGYVSADGRRFTAPARELGPGATAVVGWATGEDLTLDAR